jgi:hypothetical protein
MGSIVTVLFIGLLVSLSQFNVAQTIQGGYDVIYRHEFNEQLERTPPLTSGSWSFTVTNVCQAEPCSNVTVSLGSNTVTLEEGEDAQLDTFTKVRFLGYTGIVPSQEGIRSGTARFGFTFTPLEQFVTWSFTDRDNVIQFRQPYTGSVLVRSTYPTALQGAMVLQTESTTFFTGQTSKRHDQRIPDAATDVMTPTEKLGLIKSHAKVVVEFFVGEERVGSIASLAAVIKHYQILPTVEGAAQNPPYRDAALDEQSRLATEASLREAGLTLEMLGNPTSVTEAIHFRETQERHRSLTVTMVIAVLLLGSGLVWVMGVRRK